MRYLSSDEYISVLGGFPDGIDTLSLTKAAYPHYDGYDIMSARYHLSNFLCRFAKKGIVERIGTCKSNRNYTIAIWRLKDGK